MFFKQSGFKPRTNSGSAGSDATPEQKSTTTQENNTAMPTQMTAAQAGRRRSSATEKFAGLQNYKRNSMDQDSQARKQEYLQQSTAQPGVLGQAWNAFTKGTK